MLSDVRGSDRWLSGGKFQTGAWLQIKLLAFGPCTDIQRLCSLNACLFVTLEAAVIVITTVAIIMKLPPLCVVAQHAELVVH